MNEYIEKTEISRIEIDGCTVLDFLDCSIISIVKELFEKNDDNKIIDLKVLSIFPDLSYEMREELGYVLASFNILKKEMGYNEYNNSPESKKKDTWHLNINSDYYSFKHSSLTDIIIVLGKKIYLLTQTIKHVKLNEKVTIFAKSEEEINIKAEEISKEVIHSFYADQPNNENLELSTMLSTGLQSRRFEIKTIQNIQFDKPKPVKPAVVEFYDPEPIQPHWFKRIFVKERYKADLLNWEKEKSQIEEYNRIKRAEYNILLANWESEFKAFSERQEKVNEEIIKHNDRVDDLNELVAGYASGAKNKIHTYFEYILSNLSVPDIFRKDINFFIDFESGTAIIDLEIPDVSLFPMIKYRISSWDRVYKDKYFTQKETNAFYEDTIYQYILLVINQFIVYDTEKYCNAVNINCWIENLNKGSGTYEIKYIASIFTKRDEFEKINLDLVDPKTCFKNLKGLSSTSLSSVTPVRPIMSIPREDKRFIEGVDVGGNINEHTNLAIMDWEDFEYLIRELFEKEFKSKGGEVKVTRASRDGGVDAVAFDPDPITGGKIIIQAKRYTNIVGVSAVRDLYGTVMNEGANKGILVTTSGYGSDSVNFAKDKPLTLISGSELLYLMHKHGYQAKIDIQAAKLIQKNQKEME